MERRTCLWILDHAAVIRSPRSYPGEVSPQGGDLVSEALEQLLAGPPADERERGAAIRMRIASDGNVMRMRWTARGSLSAIGVGVVLLVGPVSPVASLSSPPATVSPSAHGGVRDVFRGEAGTVRLQIASFRSAPAARRFAEKNQLAWNDCWVARQLGVPVPGSDVVPETCTARAKFAVLRVERAVVNGALRYRVRTAPLPVDDLWGGLNAYRLAGHDPLVIK